MEMQERQLRMSERESGMAEGRLRVADTRTELTPARKCLAIATRIYALDLLILFSIEIFVAVMPNRHFSIELNAGRHMSTICSTVRRRDSFTKLATHDFDIRAARIFRKTMNRDACVSNVFTLLDLARYTIFENLPGCEEKASARQLFTREDSVGLDSATRVHGHIQFGCCAMYGTNSGGSDKILPGDVAKVFECNLSNLVTTGPVSELTMPSTRIINRRLDTAILSSIGDASNESDILRSLENKNSPKWQSPGLTNG